MEGKDPGLLALMDTSRKQRQDEFSFDSLGRETVYTWQVENISGKGNLGDSYLSVADTVMERPNPSIILISHIFTCYYYPFLLVS